MPFVRPFLDSGRHDLRDRRKIPAMTTIPFILRSLLVGFTLFQSVVLPNGGCCCAVQRLTAVLSGTTGGLPECCRLERAREGKSSAASPLPETNSGDAAPKSHCQCVRTDCTTPAPPTTLIAQETESKSPFEVWGGTSLGVWERDEWPQSLAPPARENRPQCQAFSGREARIQLQSWRC